MGAAVILAAIFESAFGIARLGTLHIYCVLIVFLLFAYLFLLILLFNCTFICMHKCLYIRIFVLFL